MAARKKPAEPVASVLPHNIPADELPRPAAVPLEARPTVRSNVVVLVPRSTPPRAA